jgi:hypothetical protein
MVQGMIYSLHIHERVMMLNLPNLLLKHHRVDALNVSCHYGFLRALYFPSVIHLICQS